MSRFAERLRDRIAEYDDTMTTPLQAADIAEQDLVDDVRNILARKEATPTWVCQCCIARLANNDTSGCEDSCDLGHAPSLLTAYPDDADLTIGMLIEEHDEECENRQAAEAGIPNEVECGCETRDWSTRPCDGCGDDGHGSRHAVTMWTEPES